MPLSPIKKSRKGKKEWIGTGEAFKQLLKDFYPWEQGENGEKRAKVTTWKVIGT